MGAEAEATGGLHHPASTSRSQPEQVDLFPPSRLETGPHGRTGLRGPPSSDRGRRTNTLAATRRAIDGQLRRNRSLRVLLAIVAHPLWMGNSHDATGVTPTAC